MEFEEFKEELQHSFLIYMSEEFQENRFQIKIRNEKVDGYAGPILVLVLDPEEPDGFRIPMIPIQTAYDSFLKSGMEFTEFVKGLAMNYENGYRKIREGEISHPQKKRNLNPSGISERLFIVAINYDDNKEELKEFPYVRKGNYAVICQYGIGSLEEKDFFPTYMTVTEKMMKKWGFSKEKMFDMAVKNSNKILPAVVLPLKDFMIQQNETEKNVLPKVLEQNEVLPEMFVITNEQRLNGAAVMFYQPEVLEELSEQAGMDITIFPVSLNMVIAIADDDVRRIPDYEKLLMDYYKSVGKKYFLGDKVMQFLAKQQMISQSDGVIFSLKIPEIKNV